MAPAHPRENKRGEITGYQVKRRLGGGRGVFVLLNANYTEAGWPRRLAAMTECVQVSTATETREQAVALAAGAVEQRLAAGAQVVGPVVSVFWHLGEQGTGEEWQLLLKTTKDRYPELESYLLDKHPWDSPEVCAVPIVLGADRCIQWVQASVEPA